MKEYLANMISNSTNMTQPIVSIITPLHNSAKFVTQTIESVLSQSFQDWELILIDDCSTDDTLNKLTPYLSNERIRLIQLKINSGAAVARNTGIEAASGRYISFLDSDDCWLPNKLSCQIGYMQEHACHFSYSAYNKINEQGAEIIGVVNPPERLSYRDMLKSNQIGCLTAMYDTQHFGKVLMPLLRKRQDYALWLRLLKRTPSACRVPEVLALYRVRKNSISSNKIEMLKYNWLVFRKAESMNWVRATYYLIWNVLRKLRNEARGRSTQ